MKVLLVVTALLMSVSAHAQSYTNPQPSMNEPNDSTFASSVMGRDPFPQRETPAVRSEKLARAIALRDEALVLEAHDGGTLSRQSQAYLRRKGRQILAYR